MKKLFLLAFLLISSTLAFAQNLPRPSIRNENGVMRLQVLNFWSPAATSEQFQSSAKFYLVPVESTGASFAGLGTPIANNSIVCTDDDCQFPLPATIDPTKQFILFIDFGGKRYWAIANPYEKAEIKPSKDVHEKRNEVLISSSVPLDPDKPFTLNQTQLEIEDKGLFAKETKIPVAVQSISNNDPKRKANVTEITVKLNEKLDEGATTNLSTDGLTTKDNRPIPVAGSIEVAGLPGPNEPPKTQITLASIAATKQQPVFDLSGTAAFRTPKFDALGGRYLSQETLKNCQNKTNETEWRECIGELSERLETEDYINADDYNKCRGKSGEEWDECRESVKPRNFFAGLQPSINFDIGFNSTKSKNSITVNFPFVYYFNFTNRSIIDTQINAAVKAETDKETASGTKRKVFPLYVYGGWKNTPFFRLADIKMSFGPKVELYRRYYPRNLLASVRADFEFHRWLGTIASRRRMLSSDLNAAASRDEDKKLFGKLQDINFGWKFVPYLAFDLGRHVTEETVTKKLNNLNQSVTIPNFGIARIYGGGVGTFEWLIKRRVASISFDYSLYYLGLTEINSYNTDKLLLLRRVRGFQPFFKTTFEFSLDPARRYAFKATYENGRAIPGTEYLNKVTTGISLSY